MFTSSLFLKQQHINKLKKKKNPLLWPWLPPASALFLFLAFPRGKETVCLEEGKIYSLYFLISHQPPLSKVTANHRVFKPKGLVSILVLSNTSPFNSVAPWPDPLASVTPLAWFSLFSDLFALAFFKSPSHGTTMLLFPEVQPWTVSSLSLCVLLVEDLQHRLLI